MVELGIVGGKNSGKTTLIEQLVRYLGRHGKRVATIKHSSHSHRFDQPGKDSYRHREAGAGLTVVESDSEMAIYADPGKLDCARVQELTNDKFDFWLVEGNRSADRPTVLLTRNLVDFSGPMPKKIVATFGPERVDTVSNHFDSEDVSGLGRFITESIIG
ncbi:MAG: molybdopterin-guanine dinucleotide biosynthesis protein B [candidate division Zixibacteria bacterium]